MNYFVYASLSMILLSLGTTTSVKATAIANTDVQSLSKTLSSTTSQKLTPFQLVSLAYQGTFRQQGIPGFAALISAYNFRTITAEDVIKAAIAAKELTPDALTDRGYLSAVDAQLFSLDRPD